MASVIPDSSNEVLTNEKRFDQTFLGREDLSYVLHHNSRDLWPNNNHGIVFLQYHMLGYAPTPSLKQE